jgi:hypothetical protein
MTEQGARLLISMAGVYLVAGLCFGILFVWRGAGRLEPAARDATPGFRLLILPGAVTLWPLLLYRLFRTRS